ncbi:MAG: hypothetical protein Q7R81_00735 [Candidatus Peregrinibacteria bacterium]|nr:hypothetical protein [Candidatus Peregrinibacteria bacterium]
MSKIEPPPKESIEEKLDRIVLYLHHMDRRDRLRTMGATIRGILGLIPLAITLYFAWYVYHHGDELLTKVTTEAAKQAAEMTKSGFERFLPAR